MGITNSRVRVEAGYACPPDRPDTPGLGIALDWTVIGQYPIVDVSLGCAFC